jgi:hypothetical protein
VTARCSREGAGVGWVWWPGRCEKGLESVELWVQPAFVDGTFENFKFYERETLQCKSLGG